MYLRNNEPGVVPGEPGLHRETLSRKGKRKQTKTTTTKTVY
jgi:hypothetical protein